LLLQLSANDGIVHNKAKRDVQGKQDKGLIHDLNVVVAWQLKRVSRSNIADESDTQEDLYQDIDKSKPREELSQGQGIGQSSSHEEHVEGEPSYSCERRILVHGSVGGPKLLVTQSVPVMEKEAVESDWHDCKQKEQAKGEPLKGAISFS
jgi:hypothetical protein